VRRLLLLTNQLDLAADTIAEIYGALADRVVFKALKQNLTLRNFVGATPNAIQTQIWTALIAMLLLKWLHYMSGAVGA
jgi:IS4 transposase